MVKAREVAVRNNVHGRKIFRVAVKVACRGKKKAAGYNLKPAMTCWECDLILSWGQVDLFAI